MNNNWLFVFCISVIATFFSLKAAGQESIALWPSGHLPNSKGIDLKDSISNERLFRIAVPGILPFFTSKAENTGTAILICPGGAYEREAYVIHGIQLAKWLNTLGINAFVLKYRLPTSPDLKNRVIAPLQDAQRAIKLIRLHSAEWSIAPSKIGVLGVSAGGHLAALVSTNPRDYSNIEDSLNSVSPNVSFSILISPVIDMGQYTHINSRKNLLGANATNNLINDFSIQNRVDKQTAPTFLVHAFDDRAVSPQNSLLFFQALLKAGVKSALHIFPSGGHNIALRNNPGSTQLWAGICEKWLEEMNLLVPLNQF